MTILQLKDENGPINFVQSSQNGSIYQYIDDSLDIGYPDIDDIRVSAFGYGGNPIKDMLYKTRKISFKFRIIANTENEMLEMVRDIQFKISKIHSKLYYDGGGYSIKTQYPTNAWVGDDTGDSGVRLVFWNGSTATSQVGVTEGNTAGVDDFDYLKYSVSIRIIRAILTSEDTYLSSTDIVQVNQNKKMFRIYKLELECEPFFTMPGLAITSPAVNLSGYYPKDLTSMYSGFNAPDTSATNRLLIPNGMVVGTEPAPTRIVTKINSGLGIIIGRDAGVSVLNGPSAPAFTGSGANDLIVYGQYLAANGTNILGAKNKKVIVEITQAYPTQFRYSLDNGSTWVNNQNIGSPLVILSSDSLYNITNDANQKITIDFLDYTAGIIGRRTVGDKWTFYTHQSCIPLSGTTNIYTNRNSVYADDGYLISTFNINVPFMCKSRYRVYFVYSSVGYSPEFMMKMYYAGYTTSTSVKLYSGSGKYDWTLPGTGANFVDLGLIDLTNSGTPSLGQPNISSEIKVEVYTRTYSDIPNPSSITPTCVYLVPAQDNNSWFHGKWKQNGSGNVTFCNFDRTNPYMSEVQPSRYHSMPLDGTYGGDFITLIPNQHNTVLMIPCSGASNDWRESTISTDGIAYCDTPKITYRPTFINI